MLPEVAGDVTAISWEDDLVSDDRYDVFITALTADPEAVSAAIAEAFEVSVEDARRHVASLPSRVKGDVSLSDADHVEEALTVAGAVVSVRKRGAAIAASVAPRPEVAPESPPRRIVISGPLMAAGGLVVCLAVYWLFIRTPTMAGLGVHELGASSGNAVVLLHGYGAPGDDLLHLGRALLAELPDLRIIVVEAPHNIGLGGRAWFNGPATRADAVRQVGQLLDELEADGSPKQGIVLLGFSQGAELAALVSEQQEQLAGTAILSGPPTGVELHGRVFVAHGRLDPIISFPRAQAAARAYATTADVTWVPFDGSHRTAPAQRDLVAWLRGCFPPRR